MVFRLRRIAIALLCMASASCAAGRTTLVGEVAALQIPARGESVDVHGYTTADGIYHRARGRMFLVGDSLRFERRASHLLDAPYEMHVVLHREQVQSVRLWRASDNVHTLGQGVLIIAAVAAVIVFISFACCWPESIP